MVADSLPTIELTQIFVVLFINEIVTLWESQKITRGSASFKKKLREWERQNVSLKYSPKFYEERTRLITRLKEIQANINAEFDASEALREIYDLIYTYKDDQGQPDSTALGEARLSKIKNLQQKINDFRQAFDKKTGLSREESQELEQLVKLNKQDLLNEAQEKRYVYLVKKQQKAGVSIDDVMEMQEIFSALGNLSTQSPY